MDFRELFRTLWESDTLQRSVDALMILSLAGFLGGIIGFEREHSHRPAGFRTHILVAVGSALVMLTSVYIFDAYKGQTNLDPARLGAQVISGIGFLGAGTILREGFSVKGLTTAASLWAVSCVGIAAGIGYYEGAIVATIFIVITLNVLKRIMTKSSNGKTVDIIVNDISSTSKKLHELITDMGGVLQSLEIMNSEKNEGVLSKKNREGFILKALIITKNERQFKTITEEIIALDGVEEIYVD